MSNRVVSKHHCQMDKDGGVIRSGYDPKKCCGEPTHHFVQYDKKYYLCPVHMVTSGFLDMDSKAPDASEQPISVIMESFC